MTEIKPLKLCRICKESKEASEFYTGRKECAKCKSAYQLNRYYENKRNKLSWDQGHQAMNNATIIKELEQKLDRKIAVLQIPERELRCSEDFNHNWFCFRWFMYTVIIIFGVLNANWGWI